MDTPNCRRRAILRGALAAGASLMFLGCQKQEESAPPVDDVPPATPGTAGAAGDTAPTSPNDVTPSAGAAPTDAAPTDAAPADAAPATSSGGEAPAASTKVSKAQAQYQDSPKGDQMCSNCTFFIADNNTCKVVEGKISPNGWSALWAPA